MSATGRTTRMLNDAIEHAGNGRAVYIVAATNEQAHKLKKMAGEHAAGIKFATPRTLRNIDWRMTPLSGSRPNCVVISD